MAKLVAVLGAVLVNGLFVLGLGWASGAIEAPPPPPSQTAIRSVEPPEPPPEPEPQDEPPEKTLTLSPQAALPPIESPSVPGELGSIAVPDTDRRLLDWAAGFDLPDYAAGQGAKGEMKEAMAVRDAELLYQPPLERYYPRNALEQEIKGRTIVQVRVLPNGRVEPIRILQSEPEGWFEQAALQAVKQFRYRPAERNGRRQAQVRPVLIEWEPPE
ncbi:MAG: energy transducer TonB [Myxococcota bacterium]